MYADKCFVIVLPMYYYMHTFYKQGKIIPIYQYQRYIWEEIKFYVVFTDMFRKNLIIYVLNGCTLSAYNVHVYKNNWVKL